MPRSVMEHSFSEVPRVDIPRSSFDRSHGVKTTFDADFLIPVLVDDVFPGDTFNVNFNFFARLATPIHPIMDNMYMESFFFFVPYRLLWVNWEKFCGAQDNPADSIDFSIPVIGTSGTATTGILADYMGLPINMNVANTTDVSALPFRAYRLIWNEWFRDENLQNSETVQTDNSPDSNADCGWADNPLKRGKRHDYFTSCLPWPQKGNTAISLPLGSTAPVLGIGWHNTGGNDPGQTNLAATDTAGNVTYPFGGRASLLELAIESDSTGASAIGNVRADLSSATAATINDLRLAFQTQRLLERDARAGTRYNETILAHFGVTVPDFRVQRPEFLGGGSSQINITPVANTSDTATENQGDLAGFGTVTGQHGFTKSFTEHGLIIGLVNARSDITYSQGIERYWTKSTRYDFYYPVLSQIGEQSVLNKEIWSDGTANDALVFGYQERYAEYRYKPARLTGLMRPDAASTLAAWHLSEDFATLPTLGATFIESNTGVPLDRAIAVAAEPHFIFDGYFQMKCARPMPLYGVPGNLDHF